MDNILSLTREGRQIYTHQQWLSMRQRRSLNSIPVANSKLSYYYTAGAVTVLTLIHHKTAMLRPLLSRLGFYGSALALTGASFLVCKAFMQMQTSREVSSIINDNDCNVTPFWFSSEAVVSPIATEDDQTVLVNRREGIQSDEESLTKFKPDYLLKGSHYAKPRFY